MQESQANSNILSDSRPSASGEVANILQSRMMAALDELKNCPREGSPREDGGDARRVGAPTRSAPQLSTPA